MAAVDDIQAMKKAPLGQDREEGRVYRKGTPAFASLRFLRFPRSLHLLCSLKPGSDGRKGLGRLLGRR